MRRRILLAILSVTGIAVVLFGVPLAIIVERLVDDDALLRVERGAVLAAHDVHSDFATNPDPIELPVHDDIALGLYDMSGTRVAGAGPPVADDVTRQAFGDRVADIEADGARIVAVPVADDEHVVAVIRAEQPTSSSDARARRIVAVLAGLGAAVIAVGAAIGYVVAGRLARPVRRLRDAAIELGDGNFAIDVPRSKVPELDEAATALTTTARRLDSLVARERAFSADASHQLRTPLAGLRTTIETELEFPRPDPTESLHEALDDIDRLERTITDLLAIARSSEHDGTSTSVDHLLADLSSAWHGRFAAAGRPLLIADGSGVPPVAANATMLEQALDVLLDNALVHGDGVTTVSTRVGPDSVTISVSDEGDGFVDGGGADRSDRGGTHGFGLPLAHRLVAALDGRMTIVQAQEHPLIDVVLPRAEQDTPADVSTGGHQPDRTD